MQTVALYAPGANAGTQLASIRQTGPNEKSINTDYHIDPNEIHTEMDGIYERLAEQFERSAQRMEEAGETPPGWMQYIATGLKNVARHGIPDAIVSGAIGYIGPFGTAAALQALGTPPWVAYGIGGLLHKPFNEACIRDIASSLNLIDYSKLPQDKPLPGDASALAEYGHKVATRDLPFVGYVAPNLPNAVGIEISNPILDTFVDGTAKGLFFLMPAFWVANIGVPALENYADGIKQRIFDSPEDMDEKDIQLKNELKNMKLLFSGDFDDRFKHEKAVDAIANFTRAALTTDALSRMVAASYGGTLGTMASNDYAENHPDDGDGQKTAAVATGGGAWMTKTTIDHFLQAMPLITAPLDGLNKGVDALTNTLKSRMTSDPGEGFENLVKQAMKKLDKASPSPILMQDRIEKLVPHYLTQFEENGSNSFTKQMAGTAAQFIGELFRPGLANENKEKQEFVLRQVDRMKEMESVSQVKGYVDNVIKQYPKDMFNPKLLRHLPVSEEQVGQLLALCYMQKLRPVEVGTQTDIKLGRGGIGLNFDPAVGQGESIRFARENWETKQAYPNHSGQVSQSEGGATNQGYVTVEIEEEAPTEMTTQF